MDEEILDADEGVVEIFETPDTPNLEELEGSKE